MRTLGFIFTLALAFLPFAALAGDTSVAVVDVVRILSKSDAAVSIDTQREKLRSGFLEEISVAEQSLRREEQDLAKRGPELSQEDYAKQRLAYEEKLISTRKAAQEKKRILEESSGKAMDYLREELYAVVQEIANERGYDLVISNKDVIAGEKSLDITEETLKRLNAKIKAIPLDVKGKK